MSTLCFNLVGFLIEFLKLYLAVVVLLKIEQRKSIWISSLTALFALAFVSVFLDFSQLSFACVIVITGLFLLNTREKKNVGVIVLSYIVISIIDMIFASVCIVVFHLDENRIQANGLLDIGLNLFSLLLLLLVCFIQSRKQKGYQPVQIKKYILLYFLGGVSLSLYLTAVQFMGMGESHSVYGDDLVIGMSLSSLVLIVVCVLLIINSNRNEHLKREAEITADLLETQKEYYTMLLQKENETRAFRHDIKQHLYCISNLYANKKEDELKQYLEEMNEQVEELSPQIQTGNDLITAITNDILRKFPEVHLQWNGMLPDDLQISSLDLCTIFSNMLLNAVEAVQKDTVSNVNVNIKFMESTMMVTVLNPCDSEPCLKNGCYISSKPERGHGYGIKNVKKCVEKNGGLYSAGWDSGIFVTEVIIPHAL